LSTDSLPMPHEPATVIDFELFIPGLRVAIATTG
jgi:hypothetical protein